ncbi:hypothetical protein VQ042_20380, partial [Aurantimonas sp. A2-1-M11]
TGNQSGQDRFPAFSNTSNPMGIPEAQGIQGFFRANPLQSLWDFPPTEEGYNLNISRYISTAMGEEEIDLAAAQKSLGEIEKQIRALTEKHNEFLRGLGLSPLPGPE